MIDSSPRRQIMRQQFPGTSTSDCVEDAVQDFPSAVYWRTAARFSCGHEWLQMLPLGVGQVRIVRSAARHPCSSAYGTDPFQTRKSKQMLKSVWKDSVFLLSTP